MKKLLIGSSILLSLAGVASYALTRPISTSADTDLPFKVQTQQKELDNHEARITNTESNVKDLQTNTNTPPSTNTVYVPAAQPTSAPTPTDTTNPVAPAPEPQPVVVTTYEVINITDSEDQDCKYTYSDGTTYQWHWKTVEYNQGTKITYNSGSCDNTVVGRIK